MDRVLKSITEEALADVLRKHIKWLNNNRQIGSRADLSNYDLAGDKLTRVNEMVSPASPLMLQEALLSGANFKGSDLSGAVLYKAELKDATLVGVPCIGTNFDAADLTGADLQGSNLEQASFSGATLKDTSLIDSVLCDAVLIDVKGLRPDQLAGCDLTLTELPSGIKNFESLSAVSEHIDSTRRLNFSILLACVYCWLTLAVTTDAMIITNSSSSNLPIVSSSVPIIGFMIAAPLMLIAMYVYFHLTLQRLWERLSTMPAIFPDGESISEKTSIWPFTGIVCSYVPLLELRKPTFYRFQYFLVVAVGWMMVPFSVLCFFVESLSKHDLWLSLYLSVALLTTCIFTWLFLYKCVATLLRSARQLNFRTGFLNIVLKVKLPSPGQRTPRLSWSDVVEAHSFVGFVPSIFGFMSIVYTLLAFTADKVPLESLLVAELRNQDISVKPLDWGSESTDFKKVKGAFLQECRLENAQAFGAFLVNADLRGANLTGGHFNNADFRNALMDSATLIEADLGNADLRHAELNGATMTDCSLVSADLDSVTAIGAKFARVDLQKAELRFTNLSGSDFTEANLDGAWFQGADLSKSIFRRATLRGAFSLHLAKLDGADFCGADLSDVNFLTQEQWDAMTRDSTTVKPSYLK